MKWQIIGILLVILLSVLIAKEVGDFKDDKWVAWSDWSDDNCTVQGNRAVPVFFNWNASFVMYKCKDGTTWEVLPGLAPYGWEAYQFKSESKE